MERVIIVDVNHTPVTLDMLKSFDLRVLEASDLTGRLVAWDGWKEFDPSSTLVVFPGNGASIIRKYLPVNWFEKWTTVSVPAKRYWEPGSAPVVISQRIFPSSMMLGWRKIVVVDDVVSSGTTARVLHRINQPWFPGADWYAVTWVAQMSYSARCYSGVHAVEWVGTDKTKIPINSLSTLLAEREIAESFANRNLREDDSVRFLDLLQELRTV